jgi:cytochrome d ubiquinol oxidase subunit I
MVAVGTLISAYWILSANSWMQHPIAYAQKGDSYISTDFLSIIFNPYNLPRYLHMVMASWLSTAFVIISISAYYLLRNIHVDISKKCMRFAIGVIIILAPFQILMGDIVGVYVYEHQPLKTAAIEGLWKTEKGADTLLFAIPSNKEQRNLFEFGRIPHGSAILNTHSLNGEIKGMDTAPPSDQPEVWPVFFAFRIMVGMGFLMLGYAVLSTWLLVKNKLFTSRRVLFLSQFLSPVGFIALLTGWITAEMGRQPWAVYGLIRTADAVSSVSTRNVIIGFILIFVVYVIIFGGFYFYFLDKTIKKGPEDLSNTSTFGYLQSENKS